MTDVAALILAAGRGARYGADAATSKVTATIGGVPLVRLVALTALGSTASPVIVVTGHAAPCISAALAELPVTLVHNADHASGMAGSLQRGCRVLPQTVSGVVVLLADMPLVLSTTIDRLIATFAQTPHAEAIVPSSAGRNGNPVLIGRVLFEELYQLTGDTGARKLLEEPTRRIVSCPVDDPGVLVDIDTPAALASIIARF